MISKTRTKFLLTVVVFAFVFAGVAHAQETISQRQITPEKRALIKDLLDATGGKKSIDDIMEVMFVGIDKEMQKVISTMIEQDKRLTPAQKKQMQKEIEETSVRTSKRYRELFTQKINFAQLVEDISIQVYSKFFTEDELKDLIAFYKSPTGQKMVAVTPELLSESMAKTSEALLPITEQFIKETAETEIAQFLKTQKEKTVKKK
jgi:hypothetical protein